MGSWLSGSPGSRAVWARLRRLVPSPHTQVSGLRVRSLALSTLPSLHPPRAFPPKNPLEDPEPTQTPACPPPLPSAAHLSHRAPPRPTMAAPGPGTWGARCRGGLGGSPPASSGGSRRGSGFCRSLPILTLPSPLGASPPPRRSPLAQVPVELPTSPSTSPCSKSGQSPRRETPRDCDGPAATVPQSLGTRCWRGLCPGALLLTRGARASGAPAFPDTR